MKRNNIIMVGLSACLLLSGCGNAIPELTEVQQDMITEYAVGTVLKYSANYDDKIIRKELEKTEEAEAEVTEQEQQESVEEEKEELRVPEISEEEQQDVPTVSANESAPSQSLDTFLATDGFRVEFQESEICDAYSGADDDVVAFELKASEGNRLLVLKYSVSNITDQEQQFDVLSKNVKAKISAAGNNRSALLTMLDNDLLHADTMIAANETRTFVILTEIKADAEVGEIVLTLVNNGEKAKYTY